MRGMKRTQEYDFHARYDSYRSIPSTLLLILGIVNYIYSFIFKTSYNDYYTDAFFSQREGQQQETVGCEIPGCYTVACYSFFIVMGCGSYVVCMYALACLARVPHLLCVVICPMIAMKMKKTTAKVPIGFEQYENEFDFICDTEDPPCDINIEIA